ncbi:DMT family transporter [Haloglycomyces albus]|uniref:DMT family transporter n=1 Tax=Haloglycomyces albus TaxID=526067 RepID=UPI00046CD24C|nr:DMT family transporter [Haloglycomyces albus]
MTNTDKIWAALFVLFWSSGFVGAEMGTEHATALQLLVWRFIVLGLPALGWIWYRRHTLPARASLIMLAVGVLGQAVYLFGVFGGADNNVPAGTIALIASLQPLVTAIASYFVLKQSVGVIQVVGLIIGLGGVAVVVHGDYTATSETPVWAFALPLLGMSALVSATLLERRSRPHSLTPIDSIALQFAAALPVFLVAGAVTGNIVPPQQASEFWFAVAWVVGLSALGGYGAYWTVVRRNGPTAVGTLLYLTPPVTAVWAWVMFGTDITATTIVGLAITSAGVLIALRWAPAHNPDRTGNEVATPRQGGKTSQEVAGAGSLCFVTPIPFGPEH